MVIHTPLFKVATLTLLICGSTIAQEPETNGLNSSFLASPFAAFTSSSLSSRDLFESDHKRNSSPLQKRQTSQCSIPGGSELNPYNCSCMIVNSLQQFVMQFTVVRLVHSAYVFVLHNPLQRLGVLMYVVVSRGMLSDHICCE